MAYKGTVRASVIDTAWFSYAIARERLRWPTALTAAGLVLALLSGGVNWQLGAAIPLVLLGTLLNFRMPAKSILYAFYVIGLSAFFTIFFIRGEALATHIIGISLLLPFALLIFNKASIDDIMTYALPFAFVQAVLVIWQGFTSDSRAIGFTTNPNYAAGFLVLSATWMLAHRMSWGSIVLMAALLFTGSRLGIGVMGVTVILIAIQQRNYMLLLAPLAAVGFMPMMDVLRGNVAFDIAYRMQGLTWPGLWGSGWWSTNVHNVPVKMALEWGISASFAWVSVTAWGLWQRPHYNPSWWLLVALGGLSMLDFYTFTPIMAGWWWMAINRGRLVTE